MWLNEFGKIVQESGNGLVNHYHRLTLDAIVVTPNRVHRIMVLNNLRL